MNTKNMIVKVAFNTLLIEGLDNTSLNELIKRTGLTKGAFYHYFKSKEELMNEVINHYLISYIDNYADELDKVQGSALEKIYTLTGVTELLIKSILPENREINPQNFLSLLFSASQRVPAIRERQKECADKIKALLIKFIAQGKEEGIIRMALSPEDLARLIFLSIRGTMFEWTLNPDGNLKEALMVTIKSITGLLS